MLMIMAGAGGGAKEYTSNWLLIAGGGAGGSRPQRWGQRDLTWARIM